MKDYNVLLKELQNLLQIIFAKKVENIAAQHYEAAAMARDEEKKVLGNAKEILFEMRIDIDGVDSDSSEKLEMLKIYQAYMEEFGFDNSKEIAALMKSNDELGFELEDLRRKKILLTADHNFTDANKIRDKMKALEEELEKNRKKMKSLK